MVNMLDEALNSQFRLYNKGQYQFPVLNNAKEKIITPEIVQPVVKGKNWEKTILPVCTIGSGALLMYLGVRRPNIPEKIYKLYQQKYAHMAKEVSNFKAYATEYLDKEYKKIIPYINNYKKDHEFEYISYTARIQDSQNGAEVIGAVDDAFAAMKEIHLKDMKAGVNGMDEFKNYMYELNQPAYDHLTYVREGTVLKLFDHSLMPRFKNGEHKESILQLEEKLGQGKVRASDMLFDIQNNLTDEHINLASKYLSSKILKSRKNLQTSAECVMDYSFGKFAKLYNLGEDFKPLFKTGRDLKTYYSLTPENLQPQAVSQQTANIINNKYIQNLLEQVDFNKLDDKEIKSIFTSMPQTFSTKQMDLLTDRIRLQQTLNLQNGSENAELKTVAGKLEYLAEKLETFGKEDLIEKCNQNYTDMNKMKLHAKLYYITSTAKKIGLTGIEDIDKFMIDKSPEYLDSSLKQRINEIVAHPEHYFM